MKNKMKKVFSKLQQIAAIYNLPYESRLIKKTNSEILKRCGVTIGESYCKNATSHDPFKQGSSFFIIDTDGNLQEVPSVVYFYNRQYDSEEIILAPNLGEFMLNNGITPKFMVEVLTDTPIEWCEGGEAFDVFEKIHKIIIWTGVKEIAKTPSKMNNIPQEENEEYALSVFKENAIFLNKHGINWFDD